MTAIDYKTWKNAAKREAPVVLRTGGSARMIYAAHEKRRAKLRCTNPNGSSFYCWVSLDDIVMIDDMMAEPWPAPPSFDPAVVSQIACFTTADNLRHVDIKYEVLASSLPAS